MPTFDATALCTANGQAGGSAYSTGTGRGRGHVRRSSRGFIPHSVSFSHWLSGGVGGGAGSTSLDNVFPRSADRTPPAPLPPRRPPPKERTPPGNGGGVPGNGSAPGVALRRSKSTHRFLADARLVLASRGKHVDRRMVCALALLFIPVFCAFFVLLKWMYGVRAPYPAAAAPARGSPEINARRIARGLHPLEYWPSGAGTENFPPPLRAGLSVDDVRAVRARNGGATGLRKDAGVRVSLVAACRDRTAFLQSALPTWLRALRSTDEVVLVDWATDEKKHVPLYVVVKDVGDRRVSLLRVENVTSWTLSRAYNVALSLARGEWVLKVDCDTMLDNHFLEDLTLPGTAAGETGGREGRGAEGGGGWRREQRK